MHQLKLKLSKYVTHQINKTDDRQMLMFSWLKYVVFDWQKHIEYICEKMTTINAFNSFMTEAVMIIQLRHLFLQKSRP